MRRKGEGNKGGCGNEGKRKGGKRIEEKEKEKRKRKIRMGKR